MMEANNAMEINKYQPSLPLYSRHQITYITGVLVDTTAVFGLINITVNDRLQTWEVRENQNNMLFVFHSNVKNEEMI